MNAFRKRKDIEELKQRIELNERVNMIFSSRMNLMSRAQPVNAHGRHGMIGMMKRNRILSHSISYYAYYSACYSNEYESQLFQRERSVMRRDIAILNVYEMTVLQQDTYRKRDIDTAILFRFFFLIKYYYTVQGNSVKQRMSMMT